MTLVTGIYAAACVLLVVGGAAKATDPGPSAGALRAIGLPIPVVVVRLGALVEAGLGAIALLMSSEVVAGLVGASYLGFALFTITALVRGTPLSTCGCLGRLDTQPSVPHVVANLIGAVASMAVAVSGSRAFIDELDHGALVAAWAVVFIVAGLATLTGRVHLARR